MESTEKVGFNIGKSNNIKIARDIFNLNLADVLKITNKGLNRISVQFISYNIPTGTVLFTFQGVAIPKTFYYLEYPITIYVAPVTQCFRCLRYGHTRNNCQGKEKCFNCSADKHLEDNNSEINKEYNSKTCCVFCKDSHKTTDKKCPEYLRQKNIKELMAFENITFFEASEFCKKNISPKENSFTMLVIFRI